MNRTARYVSSISTVLLLASLAVNGSHSVASADAMYRTRSGNAFLGSYLSKRHRPGACVLQQALSVLDDEAYAPRRDADASRLVGRVEGLHEEIVQEEFDVSAKNDRGELQRRVVAVGQPLYSMPENPVFERNRRL